MKTLHKNQSIRSNNRSKSLLGRSGDQSPWYRSRNFKGKRTERRNLSENL